MAVSSKQSHYNVKTYIIYYVLHTHTPVKPTYYDSSLDNTSSIATDTLWYQLIPHC